MLACHSHKRCIHHELSNFMGTVEFVQCAKASLDVTVRRVVCAVLLGVSFFLFMSYTHFHSLCFACIRFSRLMWNALLSPFSGLSMCFVTGVVFRDFLLHLFDVPLLRSFSASVFHRLCSSEVFSIRCRLFSASSLAGNTYTNRSSFLHS